MGDDDRNIFALAATIELERHARRNPPLPEWLADEYVQAWTLLTDLALQDLRNTRDPLVARSALAVAALGRGQVRLGALIADLDNSEIDEFLDEHMAWSEFYRDAVEPRLPRDDGP